MDSGLCSCVVMKAEAVTKDIDIDRSNKGGGGSFFSRGLFLRHMKGDADDERTINLF